MRCDSCGGKMVSYDEGFVLRPWGREYKTSAAYDGCEACGTWIVSQAELGKAEIEAATTMLTEIDRPMSGRDLQWCRKVSGVRLREMGPYLGMSVEEYEAIEKSPAPVTLLIRFAMAWFVGEFGPEDSAPMALAG